MSQPSQAHAFTGTADENQTVAVFKGPHGEAVVRRPHAQGAKRLGDGAARMHAFWRVVYWTPGSPPDVTMVADEAQGRALAERFVNTGATQ